jgi:trypsin
MSIFLIATLSIFSVFAQDAKRVENGTAVSASNALSRSMALMQFSDGGSCSASFITKKFLVTAAHCTYKSSASKTQMRLKDSKGKWHIANVFRLITHPQFSLSQTSSGTRVKNDIALIELSQEFPFAVRPLKVASISDMYNKNNSVTVVGYGWNAQYAGGGILRTGKMTAVVEKISNFYDREGLMMVPKTTQAVCPGDSGGAVLKGSGSSTLLIGVNSLSSACQGDSDSASMSEIVFNYRTWIKKYVPSI